MLGHPEHKKSVILPTFQARNPRNVYSRSCNEDVSLLNLGREEYTWIIVIQRDGPGALNVVSSVGVLG